MKVETHALDEILAPLKSYFQNHTITRQEVSDKPPLRSELFSKEQMEHHAQFLAKNHTISYKSSPEKLLKHLADNEEILFHINKLLQKNIREKKSVSPAGEWLLDNFFLIEEEIRTGKRYLPKGYSKGLPKLERGALAGFPRVYEIAIEIISHSDGHVDIHSLRNFIIAYQKVNPLTIGELWAIPIMLRLALLENLSRVAARIAIDRMDTALAHQWANRMIETVGKNPKDLVLTIADMARSNPPLGSAFVAEFSRKLQWKGAEFSLPLSWVEQNLSSSNLTINAIILAENQKQAADQISVSNSINSLRFQSKMDWREFVEAMSVVEQTLRKDVNNVYSRMDFLTRDNYRHRVEKMAKASSLSEYQVAQLVVDLAHESLKKDQENIRSAHVGYYLWGEGITLTEKKAGVKFSFLRSLREKANKFSSALYITSSVVLTLLVSGLAILMATSENLSHQWIVLIGLISLLPASHFGLALSNWWATIWAKPTSLPKLDFSKGIPEQFKTLVGVPTIIASARQVKKLVEDLEVRYLSNPDPNLLFALLTDFKDAPTETTAGDEELLNLTREGIENLNKKYGKSKNPFFLFHRPRRWNAVEKVWMGYERKRGKLTELNEVLQGGSSDRFSVIVGSSEIYTNVKYVITLDSDTQLPREAGWKMVGLMAHPLNRPVYDVKKNRVIKGYGILQPRIAISLHGATRSGYTKLHENDSGIDPYTHVISDVYQDVFHQGSFIGKGIYEVEAFQRTLNNRFPENRILSHDLLEGSYARCGYASDIQLYEEYPSRYSTDVNRRHRWIRGDWQIGNWFLPFVPSAKKKFSINPISSLSRWKIFDNLRRSLIPIALLAILILGWTMLPIPWFWTTLAIVVILFPPFIISIWAVIKRPREVSVSHHIKNTLGVTSKSILQALFMLICLPYEAYISFDAIVRTLWRVNISHRKLLEWNPSGFSTSKNEGIFNSYIKLWFAPILSVSLFAFLYWKGLSSIFFALPFILSWIVSPGIVSLMSKPISSAKSKLNDDQKTYLNILARKIWFFFENFVTADDNWLPPDNFQQYPVPVVAHRTSPTNIGLSLLSTLTAYDFGYITTTRLIDRTTNTLKTLDKLERYAGHFYNWYDTQSLHVLRPKYISTVDSGNLAGHLLTLRQGLLSLPNEKVITTSLLQGLETTLSACLLTIPKEQLSLRLALDELKGVLHIDDITLLSLNEHLKKILKQYEDAVAGRMSVLANSETDLWLDRFKEQIISILEETLLIAPWLQHTDIPEKFEAWEVLSCIPSLHELASSYPKIKAELAYYQSQENTSEEIQWLDTFEKDYVKARDHAQYYITILNTLADKCYQFADMEYHFLYDKSQHLLSIGYNTDEHLRDASFYDLLASEARLGSFVAIAQGKLPQETWFALGRRLTTAGNTSVLLSWSGSMFEYLMPQLVMPLYENTLLDQMSLGTVKKQIEYGQQQNVPWGISESCYNVVDAHLTYQYRAFGIPGLGFKRGLGQDLVIAPYATALALMVNPLASYQNLERMKGKGFEGKYGFYEAIDYTPVRLSRNQSFAVIQTYMAHHQGMSLLSLAYVLLGQPMQKRFESDPQFQTALLLLQEQVPKSTGFYSGSDEEVTRVTAAAEIRVLHTSNTLIPELQLLSNGRYHVMVTNAGGGYSRWKDLAISRWREDTTCDNWGTFCFIRNGTNGAYWSNTHQPTLKKAEHYEAIFSQDRVEFRRRDDEVETHTTIIVSPEDDVEIRRIHLTNHSKTKRNLEITSYGEVVLAAAASDDAHPAFGNLFVQTQIIPHQHAIVCTRRPRSKEERPPWMFHLMKIDGLNRADVSYETDRSKFIGRGNTIHEPLVIAQGKSLSDSNGSVLDPIISIQYRLTIDSGDAITLDMVTGIAETQKENQSLIDKYQDRHLRDRAFELSLTHSHVALRQIGATEGDAQLFARLAGSVVFINPTFRAPSSILQKNQRGQSALWSYAISGDIPIVLLHVSDSSKITLVKQLIRAHAYWRSKGLATDLVILNEDPSGYRQVLQEQIQSLVASMGIATTEKQGKVIVRPADQVSAEDHILLKTVARVIIADSKGTLNDQVNKPVPEKPTTAKLIPTRQIPVVSRKAVVKGDLQFFNGLGGFSPQGNEYVITTNRDKHTPLPWINVIANPMFGTIVSESGSSYTWFENAHEFRLTPWKNDPITDACGEAFYIRDEETGHYWSPLALPTPDTSSYVTRHGFGYSIIEHTEDGINTEVCIHVDIESPIKFVTIHLHNHSGRLRKLSVTGYVEWVLGGLRSKSLMHVVTAVDNASGALIAKNKFNSEFQNYVGFFDVDDVNYSYTTDRTEFIGRNGTLKNPAAMNRVQLMGKVGAGMDSCAAIQVPIELENGDERRLVFKIGAGKDLREVLETIQEFRRSEAASESLDDVKKFWNNSLGKVKIETPDPALNLLSNGWLLYQVLSCRLWGRSGFYQSGGAFGFRDQLQDVMALTHAQPHLTRQQILTAASRQFHEGDVQHWWHPPMGRGVRTLCSDDFLWLPFVTSHYISVTGDADILDEVTPFIHGRLLNTNEESYYDLPVSSDKYATLYEHCKQAINHGLRFGKHGLPLIGSGDWNDGMNMVGIEGKGESVWLAFFLYNILNRFSNIATLKDDTSFAALCQRQAKELKNNIQKHAWDGAWYRRAYFDDGTPLGSSQNDECRIDAIAQSWSVLSEGGDEKRSINAMQSATDFLINEQKGLIQLLEPPFDKSDLNPGYIKGYVPGVRENGGQYTHAAIWMVMAFAKLKDKEKTAHLLGLINPINHARTPEDTAVYKVEPYVMAADVYGVPPHVGRGGWTWYTGSAGWMYQLILESFLGLKREGDTLRFDPCIPKDWTSFKVTYIFKHTPYDIEVRQEQGHFKNEVVVDGVSQSEQIFSLKDDRKEHNVLIRISLGVTESITSAVDKL